MKKVSPIIFFAVATFSLFTISCQDPRVPSLEQRVSNLEQRTQQLESQHKIDADQESQRLEKLKQCIADANTQYQSDIRSNGTKNGPGTLSIPVVAMAAMDRRKQQKIEECKLLYGAR